jgi:hypothetical protein
MGSRLACSSCYILLNEVPVFTFWVHCVPSVIKTSSSAPPLFHQSANLICFPYEPGLFFPPSHLHSDQWPSSTCSNSLTSPSAPIILPSQSPHQPHLAPYNSRNVLISRPVHSALASQMLFPHYLHGASFLTSFKCVLDVTFSWHLPWPLHVKLSPT